MRDNRLVRSEVIPGTVDHFRALMQRLDIRYNHRWEASDGMRLFFTEYRQSRDGHDITPQTRASWSVFSVPDDDLVVAGIEAFEQRDGRATQVEFLDGYAPGYPNLRMPIGRAFEEFVEVVLEEVFKEQTSAESETGDDVIESDLLPNTRNKREQWKEIWSVILGVREQYQEDWGNLDTENPRPSQDDYRDAIAAQIGWKPSGKTVYRIIKAGEAGLLN